MRRLLILPVLAMFSVAAGEVPCWEMRELDGEPVLFVLRPPEPMARAVLLRVPARIPVVESASREIRYEPNRDFSWTPGTRELRLLPGSRIPFKTLAELHPPAGSPNAYEAAVDGRSWLLFGQGHFFHDLQCAVSYPAGDSWEPPRMNAASNESLPNVRAKLAAKQPLKMVVLGDSISTGLNASVTGKVPPHQPGYPELVAWSLERRFGSKVTLVNHSVGGMDAPWGLSRAEAVIADQPDLFLCAFGMNDASQRRPAEAFAAAVRGTIERVRAARPECDAIVIAPMTANPEWTGAQPALYPAYAAALAQLSGPGCAAADVTAVWTAIVGRKNVLDLSGNGLNHPNDFGHRIYADVILSVIGGPTVALGK